MSNLKNIVPPVELCKQIPDGEFEDSVFAWRYPAYDERNRRLLNRWKVIEVNWYAVKEYKKKYDEREKFFPAPTLEEVLEAIGKVESWDTATITRPIGVNARIVDTALKRWFEVKGIEVK